jgi:hypothetical protein
MSGSSSSRVSWSVLSSGASMVVVHGSLKCGAVIRSVPGGNLQPGLVWPFVKGGMRQIVGCSVVAHAVGVTCDDSPAITPNGARDGPRRFRVLPASWLLAGPGMSSRPPDRLMMVFISELSVAKMTRSITLSGLRHPQNSSHTRGPSKATSCSTGPAIALMAGALCRPDSDERRVRPNPSRHRTTFRPITQWNWRASGCFT